MRYQRKHSLIKIKMACLIFLIAQVIMPVISAAKSESKHCHVDDHHSSRAKHSAKHRHSLVKVKHKHTCVGIIKPIKPLHHAHACKHSLKIKPKNYSPHLIDDLFSQSWQPHQNHKKTQTKDFATPVNFAANDKYLSTEHHLMDKKCVDRPPQITVNGEPVNSGEDLITSGIYQHYSKKPVRVVPIKLPARQNCCGLRGIVAIGGGVAQSSDAGASQTIAIVNPLTDEFFQYHANKKSQRVALYEGFLGAEWVFNPAWAVQMGFDYYQTRNFKVQGTLLQGADLQSADPLSYQYFILTRQLLVEGKLLYRGSFPALPYLLAGVGASYNNTNNFSTDVNPFLTFTRVQDFSTTSFSYNVGAGVDFVLTDYLRLGIGYRYTDLGKAELGPMKIDTTPVPNTVSQSHLFINEALVQLFFVI